MITLGIARLKPDEKSLRSKLFVKPCAKRADVFSVKRLFSCIIFVLLVTRAAAGWYDLKPGMDQNAAVQCVGQPILKTKGRAGAEVWTYDHAGYILFNQGRVTYWEVPIPKRVAGGVPQELEERKPDTENPKSEVTPKRTA